MAKNEHIHGIRLSELERENLLNRLDSNRGTAAATKRANRRLHERIKFRQSDVPLTVIHPGGGIARLLVCARNISSGGLSFLHSGFLHKGSACRLGLRKGDGEMCIMNAHVMNCRYIEGSLHEIGVKFETRINASGFVSQPSANTSDQSVEVELLSGRVLYIDESVDELHLMKFLLETCGTELVTASDSMQGLELAQQGSFMAIMTELALSGLSGLDLAQALRDAGCTTPIIGVTADERPQIKDQALAGGCAQVIIKPIDLKSLSKILRQYSSAASSTASSAGKPLISTRWEDVRIRPLILEFLKHLEGQVDALAAAVSQQDVQSGLKTCLAIKGSAAGYGYPQISATAKNLLELLDTGGGQTVKTQLDALAALCRSACLVTKSADS
jgi:CheY-like chemotaxis protein